MEPSRGFGAPIAGLALLAAGVVALPQLTRDSYYLDVATTILMNLALTMSLRLQVSTGQLNMAHISFMGIGAYASALLVTRVGISFWAALPIAAVVAALLAFPIGGLALRVTGPYYFLITFALSEVVRLFFNNFFVDLFGGPSGLVGIPKPSALPWFGRALTFTTKLELYTLMAALLLVTAAVLVRLEHSRFGLVASAIRQGDLLAETLGVNVFRRRPDPHDALGARRARRAAGQARAATACGSVPCPLSYARSAGASAGCRPSPISR